MHAQLMQNEYSDSTKESCKSFKRPFHVFSRYV